ncbi:hypothetical protein M0805_007935 [Coniferiporia weirii]|nr:hypothetical protein M0805_007935 [Coniferiporia weirii]
MLIRLTGRDGDHYPSAGNGLLPDVDGRGSSELGNNHVKLTSIEAETSTTSCGSIVDGTGYYACSSLPRAHPEAETHQHVNLSDSIESVSRSPTISNSPGIIVNEDNGRRRSTELVVESACITSGTVGTSLMCTTPSSRPRYVRNIEIKSFMKSEEWILRPFVTFGIQKEKSVPDWKSYTHPEGQVYFSRECNGLVYLTEANLDEIKTLDMIESAMARIEQVFELCRSVLASAKIEVLLEHTSDGCSYYMMDLNNRRIFWFDEFDASQLMPGVFGIEKLDHLCHLFDYEYWMHVEHFSCHRKLEEGILEELLGILNYGTIDFMTSTESTSAYDTSDTSSLVETIKHLKTLYETNKSLEYVTTGAARLMAVFANERFYNFHGYHGARLDAGHSIRGGATKKRSWLIRLLSPVLFYVPETHLATLDEIYVDGIIKTVRWRPFQSKLRDDWNSFVLISTVLLSASVAFLAVPSVQAVDDQGLWTSPAAIPCLVSIITSLGSIAIGLLIIQQVRISVQEADRSLTYLQKRRRSEFGLEIMAIQYSLPYALLMWSMISFFMSVAIVCFMNVGNNTTTTLTRTVYGSVWLFVVVLIFWTIRSRLGWSGMDSDAHWDHVTYQEDNH